MAVAPSAAGKQHLIDPEICIRCNTCEETCPIDAVTHNDDNYVVDPLKCNHCMECISPCPTGAIDNWRVIIDPYSLDDQYTWDELPEQEELTAELANADESVAIESLEEEIDLLLREAHSATGGRSIAPTSASKPSINLFNRSRPARAVVQGNFRLTDETSDSDVRHIILDLGDHVFPVLEGQSVGIVPPGTTPAGQPNAVRLYSIASPRDGERANTNNISLTVKREPKGQCSNYLCDLQRGSVVELTGPFGATFLMPQDPRANIIMICTGTGSAPFRGFTMRRQRTTPDADGHLLLYFGARSPQTLPYFGPLKRVPKQLMTQRLVYSRIPGQPKSYVQDQLIADGDLLAPYLCNSNTHIYVCGLKGMEQGVDHAIATICGKSNLDWATLRQHMRDVGRYHVETY
ncbi:MAG: benzoyl-CoA 2,3-epoxidase subunit BoxA [Hyphomicrobiaceae bacterium]